MGDVSNLFAASGEEQLIFRFATSCVELRLAGSLIQLAPVMLFAGRSCAASKSLSASSLAGLKVTGTKRRISGYGLSTKKQSGWNSLAVFPLLFPSLSHFAPSASLSSMRILPLLRTFADLTSAFVSESSVALRSASLIVTLICALVVSEESLGVSVASGLKEITNCLCWIPCLFWIFWARESWALS